MSQFLESLLGRAINEFQANQFDAAEKLLLNVLQLQKNNLPALHIMGLIKAAQEKHVDAANYFKKALAINPQEPSLNYNLARALSAYGRHLEALQYHERTIKLANDNAQAWVNYGISLAALGRTQDAVKMFEGALALHPTYEEALANLGESYRLLQDYPQAKTFFGRAIEVGGQLSLSWLGIARIELALGEKKQAIEHYLRCLQINPENMECLLELALVHLSLKQYEASLQCYERAYQLNPNEDFLLGRILNVAMQACLWEKLPDLIAEISAKIQEGKRVCHPFTVLSSIDDPAIQLKAAQIWSSFTQNVESEKKSQLQLQKKDKIRIGYFSADFHLHATLHLMADMFKKHDKSRFEVFAFSYGDDIQDQMLASVIEYFDGFYYVGNQTDSEIAQAARELKIDIAVDLKGYTYDARPGIFAQKAAPIQVNYLGYPGTMGSPFMDYIIADPVIISEELQKYYSEKIVYLPNSYQINDPQRLVSDVNITREDVGLPGQGFVFCSFNQHYKFVPLVFDSWARILKRVDHSVLWLMAEGEDVRQNLRNEIAKREIAPERLIFADRIPSAEHLARMRLADLFLDSLPCNSHTTASDALWVGLPIVTLQGQSFAARVASSLLTAMGLPQLITHSAEQYENLAVEIATNHHMLTEIKNTIGANKRGTPLFNSALTTQQIEAAYEKMVELKLNHLPSTSIVV